jgi:hypothetical protein
MGKKSRTKREREKKVVLDDAAFRLEQREAKRAKVARTQEHLREGLEGGRPAVGVRATFGHGRMAASVKSRPRG